MSKSLGSVQHARVVASIPIEWYEVEYSHLRPKDHYYHKMKDRKVVFDQTNVPQGYKYLGNGASRMAFLGPDGVVYKRPYEEGKWGANHAISNCMQEQALYRAKWREFRAKGVHLARCRWFPSVKVLAMEFLPKAKDYDTLPNVYSILQSLGIWDVHGGNVWIDDKDRLVLVDYAS